MARDFAEREIRPIAEKRDRSENLLKDFPWDMVKVEFHDVEMYPKPVQKPYPAIWAGRTSLRAASPAARRCS